MSRTTFRRSEVGYNVVRNGGGKIGKTAYDKALSMQVDYNNGGK